MRWSREYGIVPDVDGGYFDPSEVHYRIEEETFNTGVEEPVEYTLTFNNNMNDTITVLLEQQETWTSTPAYEIVGKTRSDIKVVREETDDTNHYKEEPYHEGVYLVEVDSLTEIIDEYDGSFIVTGEGSYGEEMYGVDEHDYEVIIQNEGV